MAVPLKKVLLLEVSQNSQENICSRVLFLINLLNNNLLLKNRLWHSCFAVNFATFLRTPFFTEHLK